MEGPKKLKSPEPNKPKLSGKGKLKVRKPFKVGKQSKKFNSKPNQDVEAIEVDNDNVEDTFVNTKEISDYVSKLGLDKFAALSSSSASDSSPLVNEKFKNAKRGDKASISKAKSGKYKPENAGNIGHKKSSHKLEKSDVANNQGEQATKTSTAVLPSANGTGKKKNKQKRDGPSKPDIPKMIIKQSGKWFEDDDSETRTTENGTDETSKVMHQLHLRKDEIAQFQKTASDLLESDVQAYRIANQKGSNKSDYKWMEKMMKTGTLPDRMAAFIVRIQDSPIHNLHFLQQLISMVKVQGKQQCMMTADTVRDLFLEDLLPLNRKLVGFTNRDLQLKGSTKKDLIKWVFEDRLKLNYINYVNALKTMASDTVEKLRGKAISIVYQLLVAHPEQEEVLLQILVNKLGDPVKKMASRALFYLKKLLDEHPRMKLVVVEEVERLLFRNNISKRAQYYGICFLNLVSLKDEHASLAHKLITVYIAFFKSCVKTGDIDTKMMSGLLTGINRAFPQAREFGFQFTENLDTLYKIVQFSQFTISIQALCMLYQITDVEGNPGAADRFYRVLYEKLLAPEFKTSSHNIQLLNLVFKALKGDNNVNRIIGFIKRQLQICQNSSANLACAILFLLSEVSKNHPQCLKLGNLSIVEREARDKETESGSSSDEDEATTSSKLKDATALEQLMKSTNIRLDPEQHVCEQNRKKPVVGPETETIAIEESLPETNLGSSVVNENQDDIIDVKPDIKRIVTKYDPAARNPSYCGAELSLAFELTALAQHFHPSVALFAQTLSKRKSIKYDGNPIKDFTLTRFLERFSYRNAKLNKHRPEYHPKGLRSVPVNSEKYLQATEDEVPVEEKFFYKFFRTTKERSKDKIKDEDDSDAESIGDDEFDTLMGNYFKSAKGADESDDEPFDETEETRVDFASGISKQKGQKRQRDDSEDEEGDEIDESDVEDSADDFICMNDDDEEDLEDSDDDEMSFEDEDETSFSRSKRKSKSRKGDDMFAPAEEFAEMLEENAEESLAGSQTLINKDRADKKQLRWEVERDRWVKGYKGNSSKPKHQSRSKGTHKKFKKA